MFSEFFRRGAFVLAAGALAALGLGLQAPAARADALVLDSSVSALARGSELKDGTRIEVPSGGSVTLLLPTGRTQTIKGPYAGAVRDVAKGEPLDKKLWRKVTELATGEGSDKPVGATRSVRPNVSKSVRPLQFAWNTIPLTAEDVLCLERDAPLELVRTNAMITQRAVIVDPKGGRAEIIWPANTHTIPWPANLAKVDGGGYDLLLPDLPIRRFTLRLVDKKRTGATETVQTLYEGGCFEQLKLWLRTAGK
ncbi:MAG: hypothetical protein AB7K67_03935 [Hyphomicrobiaceae bacterium]